MGMFDYITCDYPLPDEGANEMKCQTKDLECRLGQFKITETGRLLEKGGRWNRDPEKWEDTDFHGLLRFYGDKHTGELMLIDPVTGKDSLHPGAEPEWFEYEAKFTNGFL